MDMAKNAFFTASADMKEEYCAKIVRLGELKPVEGADRLVYTIVDGFSIVLEKGSFEEGEAVIYCLNETQINKAFLAANNQFEFGERHLNANAEEVNELVNGGKTEEAKRKVGFFNKHGRVKLIRLKGCPSYGCIFKKESLGIWNKKLKDVNLDDYITVDGNGFVHPFNFDTVDGALFAEAYVPPITQNRVNGSQRREKKRQKRIARFNRMVPGQFNFHYDTQQLNSNMWKIGAKDVVTISLKEHGCVEGNTLVETKEYGKKTIKDIVDERLDCHIKSYDTSIEEVVWVPIDNFYMIPNDGEWYEIELENGKKITITGNNPVYIPLINAYRRVDELNGDEYLLID